MSKDFDVRRFCGTSKILILMFILII